MITDDTLREGLQTPNFSYTIDEKIKIAKLLSEAGIRRALVSYPSAHSSEFEVTRKIVENRYFDETFGLGRTLERDIDRIDDTGASISLHLPFSLDDLDGVLKAIRYASTKGKTVEVGLVGVTKYDENELIKLARKVVEAGADVVQLPDTTGLATPSRMMRIVKSVKNNIEAKLEVHCHNDFGGSVANAMAGIEAGADLVDGTVFGLGERNGITDIASISSLLEREGYKTGINQDALLEVYRYMENLILEKVGSSLFQSNFPVFGKNTSVHTAGTHAASSSVFAGSNYSVNVYTGKHMIRTILESSKIELPDSALKILVGSIKDLSVSTGKSITVEQINKMARELLH